MEHLQLFRSLCQGVIVKIWKTSSFMFKGFYHKVGVNKTSVDNILYKPVIYHLTLRHSFDQESPLSTDLCRSSDRILR